MKVRRSALQKMFAVLAALTLGIALATYSAAPAHAAGSTGVYISLPTWLGNCPAGGSAKYVWASSYSLEASSSAGDWGDDIVWLTVASNDYTTIVAQPLCYNGSKSYWGPASSNTIYATRWGQTWWVGPAGVRHN